MIELQNICLFFPKGIIKTALPDMSRENREQYQVVIQAKDMGGQMGGLSGTTTVNITLTDVNNNPPRFPQSKRGFSDTMWKISQTHYKQFNTFTSSFTTSLWIKMNPQPLLPENITISHKLINSD